MRVLGNHRSIAVAVAMTILALGFPTANASEIKQLQIKTGATGTRAEVLLDARGSYKLIRLSNPERLVVDFPDSRFARGLSMPAGAGVVSSVRTGQPVAGTVRIVFDLSRPVAAFPARLDADTSGVRLVLEWPGDGPSPQASAARRPDPTTPAVAATDAKPVSMATATTTAASAEDRTAPPATTAAAVPVAVATTLPAAPPTAAQPRSMTTAPAAETSPQAVADATPAPIVTRPPPMLMRSGMRPLVVAIDAGHGGQDPGAHGLNGTREKDVTLAIARELARQVNATPGLRAFLTRDSDVFIPLNNRARRASQNHADIFVSIHADAAENRSARGSSVYILSTRGASSQRARWLADSENAADIIGGERVHAASDTLTSVLLDLTQSGNMKASEDAASHVLDELKQVGNNHKADVERANFAVLRTSDKMPAMLVETAYISNPEEEQQLASPAFQRTLAGAILGGIDAYFTRQPPPGTLYAARAQAAQSAQAETPERSGIGGNR